jgi:alpha-mannosidase II
MKPNKHLHIKINNNYKAVFSSKTGLLEKFIVDKKSIKSKIDFFEFRADERSGAYLFIPDDTILVNYEEQIEWFRIEYGKLRIRMCVKMKFLLNCVEFNPTINELLDTKYPYFNVWNVIDMKYLPNTEIALVIQTDIDSQKEFYTDLNGYQYTKRKYYKKLPIQANFYPMPTGTFIQDNEMRFNILTAQPLGVSSLANSSIQIILDRHLEQDDSRGLEQKIDDNVPTTSKFIMYFESMDKITQKLIDHPTLQFDLLSTNLLNPIIKIVSLSNETNFFRKKSFINQNIPCELKLINMRSMQSNKKNEPLKHEIGLILHRLISDDCSFNNNSTKMCMNNGQEETSFSNLFQIFNTNSKLKVESTQLDLGSTNSKRLTLKDTLNSLIQPMEIKAFKIKF